MEEATLQQLVDEYLERGAAKSLILAFLERGEVDDPKQPPKTASYLADLGSVPGIERELANISENVSGRDGYLKSYGRLNFARMKKKEAQAAWEHYRDAQPHLPKKAPPTRRFALEIARWRAQELLCERESRALHKRLGKLKQAEEVRRKRQVEKLRFKGIGKLRGGVLVQMDGRAVIQNEESENVFADDPSTTIATYLEEVKQLKRERFAKKQKTTAEAVP